MFRSLHDCIVANGYVKTTLADVAAAADMTPSHLLPYCKGKEHILAQYFHSAVYFDNAISLVEAHRLFRQSMLGMCGYGPSTQSR